MKWRMIVGVLCCIALSQMSGTVFATPSLQLQPLQYVETLTKGERKQGTVDITNPQSVSATVQLRVQGFRQIDDRGNLAFFDDQRLRDGIQLGLQQVEIPAHKTLKLFFIADGSKLPTGDVMAAIFAQTVAQKGVPVEPSVRLGTLLILTNQTPGARQAAVERFDMNWLQVGTGLDATVTVKNMAPTGTTSGFFPTLRLTSWPLGPSRQITGPFVQTGNSRTITINEPTDQFGVYRVRVAVGDSSQERWAVFVTGYWRWLIFVIGFVGIASIVWLMRRRRNASRAIARKR